MGEMKWEGEASPSANGKRCRNSQARGRWSSGCLIVKLEEGLGIQRRWKSTGCLEEVWTRT